TGTSGISGEMGHFTIEANGQKCSCGNQGCWELYASENALLQNANKQNVLKNNGNITLESLIEAAKMGNSNVLQLLHTLGEYIGVGLTNGINTFNPNMVVTRKRRSQYRN